MYNIQKKNAIRSRVNALKLPNYVASVHLPLTLLHFFFLRADNSLSFQKLSLQIWEKLLRFTDPLDRLEEVWY